MNNGDEKKRFRYARIAALGGIFTNLVLFALKLVIGLMSSSIAIMADAINNLSDAGSSCMILIGFNIAAKPADREHPFGHGRMEYVAALIISVVIVALSLDFFKASIERITSNVRPDFGGLEIMFIGATILVKVGLFLFYTHIGSKIKSLTLKAAAFDSLSDCVTTGIVLVSMIFSHFFNWQLDGYAGILVSFLIGFGGVKLIKETLDPILGSCPDPEIVGQMEKFLLETPGINGIHDIIIHNYGVNRYFATAHAEVSQSLNAIEIHDLLEQAEVHLSKNMPITLVLHCDPYDTTNPEVKIWRARLENLLSHIDTQLKLYDFRIDEKSGVKTFHFHLLIPRVYSLTVDEIKIKIAEKLKKYHQNIELKIEFINSFV